MAAATGERVGVPAERWALLEMLGLPAARLFTTDAKAARIQAVLRHSVGAPAMLHQTGCKGSADAERPQAGEDSQGKASVSLLPAYTSAHMGAARRVHCVIVPIECWIKACNATQITVKQVALLNRKRPTIAILPSGSNISPQQYITPYFMLLRTAFEGAHDC